ncbi:MULTISPECIES: HIT domain-containing protein [unclassified Mesobacillus]|uniref:HIT family protein n=1 Tax=unclassified Mesobacillus TaxID=2675270 RepID=UPI00203B0D48|nr:HIT domain-containing protein [Mesobacillus sp. MER 33]MCM3231849.1 HIT domain-containing protein [Mesobacillus sp. MER 48]
MANNQWEDFYCYEVLSGKTVVKTIKETEHSLAFYHTRPYYEVHIIVIPKKHIHSFLTVTAEEKDLLEDVLQVVREVAARLEKEYGACTISTNAGNYQSNKHMHWHVHFGARVRDEKGRLLNGITSE